LLLAIVQIAYNNKTLEATGQTLYFANYRKYLNLFKRTLPSPKAKAAIKSAEKIKKIHKKISLKLLHAQNQSILYINQKQKTAP
jgi:hypothetical protein